MYTEKRRGKSSNSRDLMPDLTVTSETLYTDLTVDSEMHNTLSYCILCGHTKGTASVEFVIK